MSPFAAIRRSVVGVALSCGTAAVAQPYLDVPYVYTRSPEVFTDLFSKARCGTVRGVILGDSQETSPGGGGAVYIPRLQYEFWTRFGRAPETPWTQLGVTTGGGQPFADWLVRTGVAAPGVAGPIQPESFFPPGLRGISSSATNGNNVNNNQAYGSLFMLQHNCIGTHPGAQLAGTTSYMHRDIPMYLDVLAISGPGRGEVQVRVSPTPFSQTGFFFPTTATFTTSMGLDAPGTGVRQARVGPLPFGDGEYMQVEISGTDPARMTEVLAARFVSGDNLPGWSFTSLSAGGYHSGSLPQHHAGCGPVIGALAPDVVLLTYGANDCNKWTPAEFRTRITNLIAFVRSWTRSDLPVILVSDPVHWLYEHPQAAGYLDEQPGIFRDIALDDPLVCALNSRRLTHEAGWTFADGGQYMLDGVHYTPYGARLKAQLEAQTLFSAFFPPAVDCNQNGLDDWCDIHSGTSQDDNTDGIPDECECDADVNCDSALDGFDVLTMERAVGGELTDFCLPDPDFNGDFALDGFDVEAVELGVGGGGCP